MSSFLKDLGWSQEMGAALIVVRHWGRRRDVSQQVLSNMGNLLPHPWAEVELL